MVSEAVDFRFLLLENYKKLKLSELEVATLLLIDHLISQGNPFITADLLSLKMTLHVKEIDKILTGLLQKELIEYTSNGKKTITTLNPLKQKLYREFQMSIVNERIEEDNRDINEQLENIYSVFQKELGRTLSPIEISKIREWVSYGYSDKLIIDALKEALSKGKRSLRSVDKILLNWMAREDIETEGHTPLSEDWSKNLEETIRIAKTPWLDDDEN